MFQSDFTQAPVGDGSDLAGLVARAGHSVMHAVETKLAPFDVSFSQYVVLALLADLGQTTVGKLARMSDTDSGGMTRLLDRLETIGVLARQPDQKDRRVIRLSLTEHGRALLPRIDAAVASVQAALSRNYSDQDIERFRAYLAMAIQNASQGPEAV